ncbi:alpha/beta hydrolase [Globicatella sulfidifaciens]|uniref:Alpha/beta hydrolase n=1 Tax=Globicatella sulfidifaciens TaxID=136093 RepID=A0A7X8C577_9LACT|nr:alpha/beta hydrolase [Globicatella sulfidifaciens]NLJ18915.1 alpha/beta hydrolase [Globicatella sulfidifaciens]
MIFEFKYDYQTMPKSQATTSGMKNVQGDLDNIRAEIDAVDVIYRRKNGENLKIRLVYPDHLGRKEKYPLVFHIQGSAWFEQDLSSHILDFKEIVTTGYILAIVEYLPLPEATFPSQVEDAKCAMRYLEKHAEELRIDLDNIFLSGDSSGGHTALLCWATWNQNQLDVSTSQLPKIKGCIDLYGVVDFLTIADAVSGLDHDTDTSPVTLLLGGVIPKNNPKLAAKASVPYYLAEDKIYEPLLIIHGNKDTVVPFEQSVQLYQECKDKHIQAEFYCVNDADHGGSTFYCQAVLNIIVDFLKRHTD